MRNRLACLALGLVTLAGPVNGQDEAQDASLELELVAQDVDLFAWYLAAQAFADQRELKCEVVLSGKQAITIRGGTAEDRALLGQVAQVFQEPGAAGSGLNPRPDEPVAVTKIQEGVFVRRTDFANFAQAEGVHARLRGLVNALPEWRATQVIQLSNRVVVLGARMPVFVLGATADGFATTFPPQPKPLEDWRGEGSRLVARFDAAADAASDAAFQSALQVEGKELSLDEQLPLATRYVRALELYADASALRTKLELKEPAEERQLGVADRLARLGKAAAEALASAATSAEQAGDAELATELRTKAAALGGK